MASGSAASASVSARPSLRISSSSFSGPTRRSGGSAENEDEDAEEGKKEGRKDGRKRIERTRARSLDSPDGQDRHKSKHARYITVCRFFPWRELRESPCAVNSRNSPQI